MTRDERRERRRVRARRRAIVENIKTVLLVLMFVALIGLAGGITDDGSVNNDNQEISVPSEQKYIAKYATSIDIDENGITTFEDTDGNMWKAQDAPTELGQQARLLFDSQYTTTVLDDEIIDIIEE